MASAAHARADRRAHARAQGAAASPPANGHAAPPSPRRRPPLPRPRTPDRSPCPARGAGDRPWAWRRRGSSAPREVVVTDDGGGLAALVVDALGRRGVKARVASEVPPGADAVIFLGGLREVGGIDEAVAVEPRGIPRGARRGGALRGGGRRCS